MPEPHTSPRHIGRYYPGTFLIVVPASIIPALPTIRANRIFHVHCGSRTLIRPPSSPSLYSTTPAHPRTVEQYRLSVFACDTKQLRPKPDQKRVGRTANQCVPTTSCCLSQHKALPCQTSPRDACPSIFPPHIAHNLQSSLSCLPLGASHNGSPRHLQHLV